MNLHYFSTFSMLATLLTLNASTHAVLSMADDIAKEPTSTTKRKKSLFFNAQKRQLKALKKMSPEDQIKSQLSSNDWYTKNHARGVVAILNRNKGDIEESHQLVLAAHEDGYAPASLELVQMAIQNGKTAKAHDYFRKALENFIATKQQVPEDTRIEFAKSLVNFARLNGSLETLEEYEDADSLLAYTPKKKKDDNSTDEEDNYDDLELDDSMTLQLKLPAAQTPTKRKMYSMLTSVMKKALKVIKRSQ